MINNRTLTKFKQNIKNNLNNKNNNHMAIIGISGKSGAGKDTVGKIIQYLTNCKQNDSRIGTLEHYTLFYNKQNYDKNVSSNWTQKAFASKLKQCVSIITGIPIEDLEKEEVKNRLLGEEWNVVDKVCNICGKNWNNDPFNLFNSTDGKTYCSSCKNGIYLDSTKKITVRKLLQLLGTEVGRTIHPNFWINALFSEYRGIKQTTISENCPRQDIYSVTEQDEMQFGRIETIYPNWIITDVRFPNEVQAIKDRGGIVIKVEKITDNLKISNNHESETALDDATFDYTISAKQGDIEFLIEQTKEILIKEKIIK